MSVVKEEEPNVIDYQQPEADDGVAAQYTVCNCVAAAFGASSILIPILIWNQIIREDGLIVMVWLLITLGSFVCSIMAFGIFTHEFVYFSRRDRTIWLTLAAAVIAASPLILLFIAAASKLFD